MPRNTHAIIDLDALAYNFKAMSALAPTSKQVIVIKANAYGNGVVAVALALQHKAQMFAVAFLDEVYELRDAGITQPILVLQGPHQEQECEQTDLLNVVWMLSAQHQLNWLQSWLHRSFSQESKKRTRHWLKFDTGMHRLGLMPEDYSLLKQQHPELFSHDVVIATHLSAADEPGKNSIEVQLKRFEAMIGKDQNPLSIANSAANIHLLPARQSWNRMGISLFGSSPFENDSVKPDLKPVMQLMSTVIALRVIAKGESVGYGDTWVAEKETVLATVGIGYGDGYPRHAPIGTPAIIEQHTAHLVGRVSMDMLIFDVTGFKDVKIGSKVELWGCNLPINTVAKHVGTIGYELMTRVSQRVPRVYLRG